MILPIILLILMFLLFAILIVFGYLVLLPAIKINPKEEINDNLISPAERNSIEPETRDYDITDQKALVMCSCKKQFSLKPTNFNEVHSCFMVKTLKESGTDCKFACIGLGDCAKVCTQEAISIVNRTAVISDLCCGCGNCVDICPQKIIKMVPKNTQSIVLCSNNNQNEFTSCTEVRKETNISWNAKKDFKIWMYCYKIIEKIVKISKRKTVKNN